MKSLKEFGYGVGVGVTLTIFTFSPLPPFLNEYIRKGSLKDPQYLGQVEITPINKEELLKKWERDIPYYQKELEKIVHEEDLNRMGH